MQQGQMQDKDMMQDVLSSQKLITSNYNNYSNECVCRGLRDDMLNILRDEHEIQTEIFNDMNSRGWYPVAPAEQTKVTETKQKFSGMQM